MSGGANTSEPSVNGAHAIGTRIDGEQSNGIHNDDDQTKGDGNNDEQNTGEQINATEPNNNYDFTTRIDGRDIDDDEQGIVADIEASWAYGNPK
ncbi:uncharacterized protein J4E88_007979 [Alternaria novae-zelandiae]|uniref:uncharacterized protein n=1 Tax=Alternaria novae-zelandiae TaxID=430562 RepID=UPI0020C3445B|nr:uncharacterized protein J4E88_007979 [Alternaria novae-zelandiae]KAI4675075.1 hypothetical protein J4E88_007979 [Alternaria novae-zelandiae]